MKEKKVLTLPLSCQAGCDLRGWSVRILLALAVVLLGVTGAYAQSQSISGTVVDETNEPLIGAVVKVEATGKGASTNMEGKFKITVPKSNSILVVSYVGYKQKKVRAKDGMRVALEPDATMLEGVVVETGYQKIDRRLFTGAATKVSGKDVLIEGVSDISKMLQGKAAGVQIQNVSGTFGAAPKIRVRGASSILGNSNPIWVVDGVVLEDVKEVSADDLSSGNAATLISSAVAGINADDIESFQILKDASATALYGARAMNGVVVITTKKGRAGSMRVTYSGEFTMREIPRYSDYNILNSAEQMEVYRDMYDRGFLNFANTARQEDGGEFYVMSKLINTWDPKTGQFGMPNTPEAREDFFDAAARRNTNWFKELFRSTLQHNHAVSISGGNEKSRYYGSLSYFNDPGWTVADKVDRYTANFNISYNFSQKLKVNFLTNTSVRLQKAPGTQDRTFNAVDGAYSRDFDINPFSYALNTSRTMRVRNADGSPFYYQRNYAPFSILNELRENTLDINMMDGKMQAELHYSPIKQLEFSGIGSVRFVKTTQESSVTERANKAMAYRATQDATVVADNRFLYTDPDRVNSYPQVVLPVGGFYDTQDDILKNYYFRATGNYNNTFAESHVVNVLAGSEVKYTDRKYRFNDGYGMQFYKGGTPFTDYHIMKQLLEAGGTYFGYSNSYDRFAAFFATASYSYQGKYTVNVTGRYDGSNLLGLSRSARWLPTWNVSGSWNIRETLLPGNKMLSRLLVRATYGLTATMGPARNSRAVFYNSTTFRGIAANNESYTYIYSLANNDLTWEKQYETNIGVDLGLFRNRISFSGDVYWRRGFDLIGSVKTSGIGGQETKRGNFANMKSHGIEFTLNTRNIVLPDFDWITNLTFSYNTNEITKLESYPRLGSLVRSSGAPRQGYPVRSLFSIPFRGLNEDGIPLFENEDGEVSYKNIDFQKNQGLEFLKYEGPIDPTYTGGLENTFRWKDLSLGFYFTYQAGNVIRLEDSFSGWYSDQQTMPREMLNRWSVPGDEAITNVPAIISRRMYRQNSDYRYAYHAYNKSDVRVAKGDYFRLKDLTIGYRFPARLLSKVPALNSAQVKFVASNLWLIYADKKLNGIDPEFSSTGGVAMPTPHQYTLSVRFGF